MREEEQCEDNENQEEEKNITMKELEKCISAMQNNKAPGPDEISAECLKNLTQKAREALLRLINLMWDEGYTPNIWKNAETKLIHKKDDTSDITNYRPITLLNTLFKLWEKILDRKARDELEGEFPNQLQMGSQAANSASMTVAASKAIMHTAIEAGLPVYTASVDMNKAYNRVNRQKLWVTLRKMEVPKTPKSNHEHL